MNEKERISAVIDEVAGVIIGKRECIEQIFCAILADGHVLIEDIPGVGKTTLALAFAAALGLEQKRMQFTPDIMPSDLTGFTMYQKEQDRFVYQPGAVMCNMFVADEINRTSPKTQSALLEVMEENAVTVDGVTRRVPEPFIVIATENPVGYTGTQMLPESQLDRFEVCVPMGYPSAADELQILRTQSLGSRLENVHRVISTQDLLKIQAAVSQVHVSDAVYDYMIRLSAATRAHPGADLGFSPRGSLALAAMARAHAFMEDRDYVNPGDVAAVFLPVGIHRLRLSAEARMNRWKAEDILRQVLEKTEAPLPERKRFLG